jgi:HEAT repeats
MYFATPKEPVAMKSAQKILTLIVAAALTLTLLVVISSERTVDALDASRDAALAIDATPTQGVERQAIRKELGEHTANRDGFYWAPRGSRFVFAIESRTSSQVRQEQGSSPRITYTVAGEIELLVVDRIPGELMVQVTCLEAAIGLQADGNAESADTVSEKIAAELRHKSFLRMQSDGQFLGIRFAPEMSAETRGFLRSLVGAMQFPVRDDSPTWESDEADSTGLASYRYTWELRPAASKPGLLRRHKLGYKSFGEGNANLSIGVTGTAEARMCVDRGFVIGGEIRETLELPVAEMKATIATESDSRFDLIAHDTITDLPQADWAAGFGPLQGHADAELIAAQNETERMRRQLAGVDLQQLIQEILLLVEAGDLRSDALFAAREQLRWMVKLSPELLEELQRVLLDPSLSAQAQMTLLGAVGSAGTPEAESCLNGLLASGRNGNGLRRAAAMSLFHIEKPVRQTARTLQHVFRDSATDSGLASTSILVLGAFASDASSEATTDLVDQLLAMEQTAIQRGMLTSWLEALGNARTTRALTPATRHLADSRPEVRNAAIHALHAVHTPAATSLLVGHLSKETVAMVRSSLVDALGTRDQPIAMQAIAKLLRKETDERIRRRAILALAQLRTARAIEILTVSAKTDASAVLRNLARRSVAGA